MIKMQTWLRNEFLDKDEFCSIECLGDRGNVFYPENTKFELGKNDVLIGKYWFDGQCWCFSLFPEYSSLSI